MTRSSTTSPLACKARRTDGERCGAFAIVGSDRCFWHTPSSRSAALAASAKGGAVPRQHGQPQSEPRPEADVPEAEPLTPTRARGILAGALEAVARGALDPGTGHIRIDRSMK